MDYSGRAYGFVCREDERPCFCGLYGEIFGRNFLASSGLGSHGARLGLGLSWVLCAGVGFYGDFWLNSLLWNVLICVGI